MIPTQHTVLITGGATGIGFALAKKFHAAGNRVILVGRREDALRQAVEQLSGEQLSGSLHDNGARCGYAVADVSQAEDRARLAAQFPEPVSSSTTPASSSPNGWTSRRTTKSRRKSPSISPRPCSSPAPSYPCWRASRRPPLSTYHRAWRWCPRKPAPFTVPPKPRYTAFRKCCAGSWKQRYPRVRNPAAHGRHAHVQRQGARAPENFARRIGRRIFGVILNATALKA